MDDFSSALQRQIALYTPEAGFKLQRGDRLLGAQRGIAHEMQRCFCGLCVSTNSQPHTSCTLFDSDGATVVQRQQTELCKSVCLSRSCVSMLQRLIRGLLKKIAIRCTSAEGQIRLSVRRDVPSQPYVFEMDYFDGELLGSFFVELDRLGGEEHFRIPYSLGQSIEFAKILKRNEFKQLHNALERTLVAEAGQAFSLVVIAPGLPNQDLKLGGVHFRNEGYGTFRARPIYLFVQATSY